MTGNVPDDAAQAARKRRIAARNRSTDDLVEDADITEVTDGGDQNKRLRVDADANKKQKVSSTPEMVLSTDANGKPKPHITGIKKQSRYDPGIPMSKEELKAWRKEARRVRNRESAAASRKKNKERITELETEVDNLQTKYAAALKLLLQHEAGGQRSMAFVPAILRQDLMDAALDDDGEEGRSSSPVSSSTNSGDVVAVSPPMSPSFPVSTHERLLLPPAPDATTTTAAKISPGADDTTPFHDDNDDQCNTMNVDHTVQGQGIPTSTLSTGSGEMSDNMDTTEAVTDVSSTSSDTGSTSYLDDEELDALAGTDLGEFLLDTFVPDDVIDTALDSHQSAPHEEDEVGASTADMSHVATAAMLMVDMPELCI